MIRLDYIPDNTNSQQVFNRLVHGLKDVDGTYIQKGMPETLMFDKRMSVVPYKEQGAIFKVTSKDDPNERIYFITLNGVFGRFLKNENIVIKDIVSYTKDDVYGTVVSSRIDAVGIKVTSPNVTLTDEYLNFSITGDTSKAYATIRTQSIGVSKFHPHTLTVVPTDLTHPTVDQTYFIQFVPNKEVTYLTGVKLSKGWNYIVVENETTGDKAELILNCRYYATVMQSVADEIYKWVSSPIDRERSNIYHYLSTRLCEMYITYKDLMPNIDTVQRLGLVLSIKSLISFSGSNISTKEVATALTGNTPSIIPQAVDKNFLPAIWQMYNQPQDFSGVNMHVWIRNRQMLRWLTFIKYINNVPFYNLNSVSENDVSLNKVMPFFGYYTHIKVQPLFRCGNCGYWTWDSFTTCPDCECNGSGCNNTIEQVYLNFKEGEQVRFSNGATATVAIVYPKALVLSNFSAIVNQDSIETIVEGETSKARAILKDVPIEHHDWNRPVTHGYTDTKGNFTKSLEWHEFKFSDEPLNDDWRILNCFSGVYGQISILSLIPMSICAAFWPWDTYVDRLLSYEPTTEDEAWYRTHQLDIDKFWDESQGHHTREDDASTYSRHSDYGPKTESKKTASVIKSVSFITKDGDYISLQEGDVFHTTQEAEEKLAMLPEGQYVLDYRKDSVITYLIMGSEGVTDDGFLDQTVISIGK